LKKFNFRTALAESELEYNENHESTAIYCKFQLEKRSSFAIIWTTTPWTIPANQALAVNPDFIYSFVTISGVEYFLAKNRLHILSSLFPNQDFIVNEEVYGHELLNLNYFHPLSRNKMKIMAGNHVTDDAGTGIVHTAPGHGFDDYQICKGYELVSPVDQFGKFTKEAGPELEGLSVLDKGSVQVIKMLNTYIIKKEKYIHKYPYDWRTKKPVIVRATKQWFANLNTIQDPALESLDSLKMVPSTGKHVLKEFIKSRSEWCISRQRSWGVPLPIFYDNDDNPLINEETINHFIDLVEKHGTDCWWEMNVSELLHPKYDPKSYSKSLDTLDVWFDSGSSWTTLNGQIADIYLEGSDQNRGWFQSSLLTSSNLISNFSLYSKLSTLQVCDNSWFCNG
jgi:isoleucyl-tRNA synthetase